MRLRTKVFVCTLACLVLGSCGSGDSAELEEQVVNDARNASESGDKFTVGLDAGATGAFLVCPYTPETGLPDHVKTAIEDEGVDLRQDGAQYIISVNEDKVAAVSEVRRGQGPDFCSAETNWSSPYWYEFTADQEFQAVESEASPGEYVISRA